MNLCELLSYRRSSSCIIFTRICERIEYTRICVITMEGINVECIPEKDWTVTDENGRTVYTYNLNGETVEFSVMPDGVSVNMISTNKGWLISHYKRENLRKGVTYTPSTAYTIRQQDGDAGAPTPLGRADLYIFSPRTLSRTDLRIEYT